MYNVYRNWCVVVFSVYAKCVIVCVYRPTNLEMETLCLRVIAQIQVNGILSKSPMLSYRNINSKYFSIIPSRPSRVISVMGDPVLR